MGGLIEAVVMGGAQGYRNAVNKDTETQADIDKHKQLMQMELEMKDAYLQRVDERKRDQTKLVAGEIQAERDKEVGAAGASQISKGLGQMSHEAEASTAQALAQYPEARAAYAKTLGGGADLSGGLISAKPIDELKAKESIATRIGALAEADMFRKQIDSEQAGVKDVNLAKHYEDALSETIRSNKANEANNRAGAGLRAIQTDLAKLQLERAQQEAKIPAAVNKQLDSFNKEIDILRSAASKSDFDPSTPNGIKVIGDLDKLREGYGKLISPYLPKAEQPSAAFDPSKFDNSAQIKSPKSADSIKADNRTFGQKSAAQRRDELSDALLGKVYSALNAGEKSRIERELEMAANRARLGY